MLVVCGWTMTLLIAWLLILPGVVDTVSSSAIGLHNGLSFQEPFWYRTVFFVAAAVVASSFSAVVTYLTAGRRQHRLGHALGPLAVLGLAGYPVLLMAADWSRTGTIVGLAVTIAAVLVELAPPALIRSVTLRVAGVSALTAVTWLIMIPAQLTPDRGYDWAWNGTWSVGLLFAVFGGMYAIVRAVRGRAVRVRPLARSATGLRGATIATAIAVAFVVLRITLALDWFGTQERALWELRDPISWVHAAFVAAVLVMFAVRSQSFPRSRRGGGLAATLLVLAATAPFVQWVLVFLFAVVSAAFDGPVSLESPLSSKGLLVAIKLVPLIALAVVPWSRQSIGRVAAFVAIAFYLPALPGYYAHEVLAVDVPQYVASPSQVVVVIVAACVALLAASVVVGRPIVPYHLVVLLATVPLVAVTGGLLLPEVVGSFAGNALVVAGSLAALVFGMPIVAADPRRRSPDAVRFTAFNLLVLASYATAIGQMAPYDEPLQGMAVDWVALPLAAVLCCQVMPRTAEDTSSGHVAAARAERSGRD